MDTLKDYGRRDDFIFDFLAWEKCETNIHRLSQLIKSELKNKKKNKVDIELQKELIYTLLHFFIEGHTLKQAYTEALRETNQDITDVINRLQINKALKALSNGKFSSFQDLYKQYISIMLITRQFLHFKVLARMIHAERRKERRGSVVEFNLVAWAIKKADGRPQTALELLNRVVSILNNYTEEDLKDFDIKTVNSRKTTLCQERKADNYSKGLQAFFEKLLSPVSCG